jgi:hypothetical protein
MAANAKATKNGKNEARKPRLSPELAELLHMLGALEQHYAAEPAAPRA